ncbi:FxLYD domain-containing protein [Acidipropionibacterium timonense]|uniref:FxLYD domain-containing protein n=1 Tax=Acidipropionibacterium timonense TaxID=2161818 RepID=UPI001AEC1397|nr:FxLYD domain-containing protein [Acidipropionibacterium timonense]
MPPQQPVKQKKPIYKRAWFWILIVLVFLIAGIAQCSGSNGGTEQKSATDNTVSASTPGAAKAASASTSAANPDTQEKLTLLKGWKIDKSDGISVHIRGYVLNNTDKPINNYIEVTFNVYDAEGNNIDTCLANTNTIDAHGKWKFDAICLKDPSEIKTVKFKELTGF